ncbi:hypothetical protein [Acuticoccus sp. I52.16.1]|uniref:hypothetical protein n=1 Tax=Acuticoccus sp. I52.16.1 TaxID=2928472 RepID=UPI001FD2CA1C|nr:hypothetical protein [Acuticoccus sp. I52.16.1]UOM33186.1 hypothetical protein MRB58_15100 [Acuticoccus sp. I52.16.1]
MRAVSGPEIGRSLEGAWRLFRNRPDGIDLLDRSIDGFWRSFWAILLVLPIDAISLLALSRIAVQPPFGEAFAERLPVLALDWVAFPILLACIAKPLGVTKRYVTYVVARNWAAPISWVIVTIPLLLQGAGFMGDELAVIATIAALMVAVRYHYLIMRIALGVTLEIAIALVVVDLVISFLIVASAS